MSAIDRYRERLELQDRLAELEKIPGGSTWQEAITIRERLEAMDRRKSAQEGPAILTVPNIPAELLQQATEHLQELEKFAPDDCTSFIPPVIPPFEVVSQQPPSVNLSRLHRFYNYPFVREFAAAIFAVVLGCLIKIYFNL